MKKGTQLNQETSSGISLSIHNDATKKKTVYVGQAATLDVVLTNYTGRDIDLPNGSTPATLEIYLPEFFTTDDLKKMGVKLPDWTFSVGKYSLKLEYIGKSAGIWKQGGTISF